MSEDESFHSDDLDDLIGSEPEALEVLELKREFDGWHRPRKQYVRRMQWRREINQLVRDLHLRGEEFRYLTLPGDDFLDVRDLQRSIVAERDLELRYLGFNRRRGAGDDPYSSESAQFDIRTSGKVGPSYIVEGDIREIGQPRSPSWQAVERFGGFHAVNLDLCDSLAAPSPHESVPSYFRCLDWLLHEQSRANADFVLLLTTRVDPTEVKFERGVALASSLRSFIGACEDYRAALSESFPDFASHGLDGLGEGSTYLLAILHWIYERGVHYAFQVELRSVMAYRTGDFANGDDDLVSVAVRFRAGKALAPDPSGLSTPVGPEATAPSLCEQAAKVPPLVGGVARVDQLLASDETLFTSCVQESADILDGAGYDREAYMEWAYKEGAGYPAVVA